MLFWSITSRLSGSKIFLPLPAPALAVNIVRNFVIVRLACRFIRDILDPDKRLLSIFLFRHRLGRGSSLEVFSGS